MVYLIVALVVMVSFVSIGVDVGRIKVVKLEMQRAADATARGIMTVYEQSGYAAATLAAGSIVAANPVDGGSVTPTIVLIGGTWNTTAHTFSTTSTSGLPAVRVTLSRTKANGNPITLFFTGLLGFHTWDVTASATAAAYDPASVPVNIPSRANLYLAGMPNGSSNPWGDTMSNATPYEVSSLAVIPGTWITMTGASGTSSIVPGYTGYYGASGNASMPLHHGENYDGGNWNEGAENGIADAVIPADCVTGVFLNDNAPNTTAAPATVDWTSAAQSDQLTYSNIDLKQPFAIGDGKTTSGTVQRFLVPQGATRLYLSIWDGVTSSNNSGSISATITMPFSVMLVQ